MEVSMKQTTRVILLTATALSGLWAIGSSASAHGDGGVVASIKPIHSLAAGVMAGVGEPTLLLKGGASPHTYSLKPSDAAALEDAEVVFWVGEKLEAFLADRIDTLAHHAAIVGLMDADGLVLLDVREGGTWEGHDHDHGDHGDHGHDEAAHDDHDDHDDHGHDDHAHDDHGHDDHGHDDHGHEEHAHDDHGHGDRGHDDPHHGDAADAHLWLDPDNAIAMVGVMVDALSEADADNAAAYKANGEAVIARLEALDGELRDMLEPVSDKPFIVFHDAYQYLEAHYGLNGVGSITISPEVQPGAARIVEIRDKIGELGAVCVFSEPQFEPRLVATVTEGSDARTGVLDPLGADLTDGPDLYFDLMRANAKALADCLGGTS